MLIRVAAKILVGEMPKYAGAMVGIIFSVILVVMQTGFYQGFQRDITIIPDSFDADIWITGQGVRAFDYPMLIDDMILAPILSDPDISVASRVAMGWVMWRQPESGVLEMVVVIGYEVDTGIRFDTGSGIDPVERLQGPAQVMIDHMDRTKLGLFYEEQPAMGEILNLEVQVAGYMRERRLFTTAPLILTNYINGLSLTGTPEMRTHYIALKSRPGVDPETVARRLRERFPEYQALTAAQIHRSTQHYWQTATAVGPLMLLAAALAAVVGFLTVLATFYVLILQKLPTLGGLRAIGASLPELGVLVAVQVTLLLVGGLAISGLAILFADWVLAKTLIAFVLAPHVVFWTVAGISLSCYAACVPALWMLARTDPALAFRS